LQYNILLLFEIDIFNVIDQCIFVGTQIMINKKALFAALCLLTPTAFATPFDGFYVGAGLGFTR